MSKATEHDMALVRVRKAAQLTLPAEMRRALNVEEGDYLEAEIVKDGVLLKPVSVIARRRRAWERIEEITSHVRDRKPDAKKSNREEEEEIAASIKQLRHRKQKKHA
jgi:AbrB family looped-hinge helix DNA binding protein